jgi:hypothetical protein
LQYGSCPSRAGEQPSKAEGGSRERKRIDREPHEHHIGAQSMVEQHAAQALENIVQPRLSLRPICNAFLERGGSLFGCVFASGDGAAAINNADFSRWCYVTIGNPVDGANAAELDVVDPGLGDGGEQSVPAFGPHFSRRSTACLGYGLGARVRTHRS